MRRERIGAAAIAAFVVAFWLWSVVLSDEPAGRLAHDLLFYYLPSYEVSFERLRSGELPVWNPYHGTGLPWLATLQTGVFYPPHLVYLVLPLSAALAASHLMHLLLIALSTAALARRAGISSPGAGLAAVSVIAHGLTLMWLVDPSRLEASAWLPLGAYAVLGTLGPEPRRSAALLGLCTAMSLLAGYPQGSVFCLYAWATLGLVALAWQGPAPGTWIRGGLWLGAAVLLGVLTSGIQLGPAFDLTRESARSAGPLSRAQVLGLSTSPSWTFQHLILTGRNSLGVVALMLAPAALVVGRGGPVRLWALLLGALTLGLAHAAAPPWIDLYRSIPVLGWFRYPQRLLFVTAFCTALLSGLSLDALRAGPRRRAVAAVAAGCGLALASYAARVDQLATAGFAGLASLGVGSLALPRLRFGSGPVATVALAIAVLSGAVAQQGRGSLPYSLGGSLPHRLREELYRDLAGRAGEQRVASLLDVAGAGLKRGPHYGLRWLDDYEPLNLARSARFAQALQHGDAPPKSPVPFAGAVLRRLKLEDLGPLARRRRLLDLASVRFLLTARPLARTPEMRRFVAATGLIARPAADPRFLLLENPGALPRAFVTYRLRPSPGTRALLRRMARPDFAPYALSYVEGALPPTAARAPAGHPARIVRDEPSRVEIEAELQADGLVVLADSFARGWSARVDGEPAPILATNHQFRGVPAPAGRHRISFEYRAPHLAAGALASLVGAVALGALAVATRRP